MPAKERPRPISGALPEAGRRVTKHIGVSIAIAGTLDTQRKEANMKRGRKIGTKGIIRDPRHCSSCKQDKPLTEFSFAPSRPGGRMYQCRDCERQKQLVISTRRIYQKMTADEAATHLLNFANIYQTKLAIFNEIFGPEE
jgi:hypothetical protein